MTPLALSSSEAVRLDVERAIGEFRMNRPVIVTDGGEYALAWTTDHFCSELAATLAPQKERASS